MGLVEDAYRKLGQYVDPKGSSGNPGQGSSLAASAPQCMCPHQPGCPATSSSHAQQQAPYAPLYTHPGNIQPQYGGGGAAHNPTTTPIPSGAIAGPGGYYLPFDDYKRLLKDRKRMKQLKGTDYAPGGPLGPQGYFMTHQQEKKRRKDKEEDEIWDAIFGEL
ncbi:uncharacterized protein LOC62_05G007600 [Vanrija pseudolonga]|uniref:Uncharacterized protein n=1 Tax=Vanrija pseudolonga TaxID=143232 RepID=A0AAF0YDS5_9TREE|nr:hypothetical protein LOC62_05G007600 [Vanrija pseudolonga]